MLTRVDEANPRIRIRTHAATVRTVPLLAGAWFYASSCRCGAAIRGSAATHSLAESDAVDSLSCSNKTSKVTYQEVRNPTSAAALVGKFRDSRIVIEPYGQVALKGTWIPGDVAVDASLVQKTKVLGVAAVSGAGWVQLRRLEEADGYSSREAEFIALTTGLGMVPEGNSGTLYSDNKGVVAEINNILARGHREGHRPPWLSKMVYNRLWTLLERRRMIIVWRRRNSTELMQLADSFAWRCSRPEFDGQAVSEALIWKRGAGRNLDENVEHIQRVEHRYCSTGGWHLHSL